MSGKTGLNIKDPGSLVLYVDASNPNSYDPYNYPDKLFSMVPGGKDLQTYGYPYYQPQDSGGSLTFSTASQQRFLIPAVPLTTESFAVEIWFRAGKPITTNGGWQPLIGCGDIISSQYPIQSQRGWSIGYRTDLSTNYTRIFLGVSVTSSAGPATSITFTSFTPTVGQVYNFLLQRNTIDQKLEFYINGTFYGSIDLNNTGSLDNCPSLIGSPPWVYASPWNNNTYYSIKMYKNTQFSEAEVQQNFNTVRNKFGI